MLSTAFALFVAVQHLGFLVLEMFLWETPTGLKVFRQSAEHAAISATLAKNQGLYNGFLAAGLVWGVVRHEPSTIGFFFGCVIVAGLFGGATVSPRILAIQALPAAIGLAVLLAGF
jgi:putative membrane protein